MIRRKRWPTNELLVDVGMRTNDVEKEAGAWCWSTVFGSDWIVSIAAEWILVGLRGNHRKTRIEGSSKGSWFWLNLCTDPVSSCWTQFLKSFWVPQEIQLPRLNFQSRNAAGCPLWFKEEMPGLSTAAKHQALIWNYLDARQWQSGGVKTRTAFILRLTAFIRSY